jgi:N-acetyltransferase
MIAPATITLETDLALLRLLQVGDTRLLPAALDPEIWNFMITRITNPDEFNTWLNSSLDELQEGKKIPFVIIDKATGNLAGSTSYGNISVPDKRLEIGWTWLGKDYWGSGLNRNCKFLLLSYAFEVLQFERVELKTDVLNLRSRKAMLKIGATEEGILRSHTLMHDGRRRDTIYYSILRHEWPVIKTTIFKDLVKTGVL